MKKDKKGFTDLELATRWQKRPDQIKRMIQDGRIKAEKLFDRFVVSADQVFKMDKVVKYFL